MSKRTVNEEDLILAKLIHKALLNGLYPHLMETIEGENSEEFVNNLVKAILEMESANKYRLIFSKDFAHACGYTLSDLGGFIDDGGTAIDYLKRFIFYENFIRSIYK